MVRPRQPIKWHGGKYYMAKKIISVMPEHTHYLEAFAGGLSVLLNKPCDGISETVNDLNGDLMNFWRVMSSPDMFEDFIKIVSMIPLGKPFFQAAKKSHPDEDRVTLAVKFFIRMRQSRQGLGMSYCTPTKRTRGGMNENVSAWISAVEGLPEIHDRLRRVEVLSEDACAAIQRLDHPDLLVYCDPPYMSQTRSSPDLYGDYEMKYRQHEGLLNTLSQMKGKFILSGYPSELYKEYEEQYSWDRREFDVANSASGRQTKERKTEVLWANFSIEEK
jgi:DNA adenine methylase